MADREELEQKAAKIFVGIGLAEPTAKQVAKNRKTREELLSVIEEAGTTEGCHKSVGVHLYQISTKFPLNARRHRKVFMRDYIMSDKIKANNQLDGALEYLGKIGSDPINQRDLEAASGVGVVVTTAQLAAAVKEVIADQADLLHEERYHAKPGPLQAAIKGKLKWAEGAAVKAELEAQMATFLGPKTEADLKPPDKKAKKKKAQERVKAAAAAASPDGPADAATQAKGHASTAAADIATGPSTADDAPSTSPFTFLPLPEDNNKVHTVVNFSDGRLMEIKNTADQLHKHLARTGRRVITRFPPEPNGYLHIGHAKAMFVSFGMAAEHNGDCFLRFDDTNPEAEKMEYIDHIQDIVSWMGWKPYRVTYSSDYFTELHQFAVQLIKAGCAYVDHQTADEIKLYREERRPSPWRERPVEESLRLFEDMRRGLVDEGKATLRMKQDVKNENYNMFDLIAYRVKFTPHPHAGNGWCIYPSYDFTHCLVDVLEDVTHSLCTLEFESRRASYFWLLEVLDCYKPVVWEYARLNVTNNVLSKRKLNKLANGGIIRGWDDPRLLTLAGLRRRGVTPLAINSFCRELGITRSDSAVHLHKLDHHIRLDLDANSPRCLAVLRPLRVVLTNLDSDFHEIYNAKVFPNRTEETYPVSLTQTVYIEETDFREQDSKDYYGLAPGKSILLKYAGAITCTDFTAEAGHVTEVRATFEPIKEGAKPPKGVMNWVSEPAVGQEPFRFEARLYSELFKSLDPSDLGDAWMDDLNPESETVIQGAFASTELSKAKAGDRFQLERLGYFCVDSDSTNNRMVVNRTCTLRESASSKVVKK